MTKQVINVGTSANDRKGDSLRAAFQKTNANFTELYERAVNTDAQTLTLTGDTLAISGGNAVDLSKYVDTSFSGDYEDLINKPTIPDVSNFITAEDLPTDLIGSVFADDSTLLVDGVNGVIPAGVISGKLDYDTVPIEYLRFPEPDVLVVVPTPAFPGTKGEIIYAAGFVYICVASNTWVRAPVETAWG